MAPNNQQMASLTHPLVAPSLDPQPKHSHQEYSTWPDKLSAEQGHEKSWLPIWDILGLETDLLMLCG